MSTSRSGVCVPSSWTWVRMWMIWPIFYRGSDIIWLLRPGHKSPCIFPLTYYSFLGHWATGLIKEVYYPEATMLWGNHLTTLRGYVEKDMWGWSTAVLVIPGEVSDMGIKKSPWMSNPAEPSDISSLGDYLSVTTLETPRGNCLPEPIQPAEPWGRIYFYF